MIDVSFFLKLNQKQLFNGTNASMAPMLQRQKCFNDKKIHNLYLRKLTILSLSHEIFQFLYMSTYILNCLENNKVLFLFYLCISILFLSHLLNINKRTFIILQIIFNNLRNRVYVIIELQSYP